MSEVEGARTIVENRIFMLFYFLDATVRVGCQQLCDDTITDDRKLETLMV